MATNILTLPPPLMTSEPGSFAQRTILERKPQIIRQVLADTAYPPEILWAMRTFRDEIHTSTGSGSADVVSHPIRPLTEDMPDVAFWNEALTAYEGQTWLDAPWYFAETYFYRRLLEATHYFQPGPWQTYDPFGKKKREQDALAVLRLKEAWTQFTDLPPDAAFDMLLHSCLWGNRADLSNFTIRVQAQGGLATHAERPNVLIDHTETVHALLASGVHRVAFINDNVGMDILFDLVLADFLLTQGWTHEVVFHLKDRPFFVSDAMGQDVLLLLAQLNAASDTAVQALGVRLHQAIESGQLVLKDHPFWTSPLMFRAMPPDVHTALAGADLVILKGDVNYRRLLDDAHWPYTTRMETVTEYFPAPFVTVRTLKGEILVGLAPGQAEALLAQEPDWLINGKRGVIHLVK